MAQSQKLRPGRKCYCNACGQRFAALKPFDAHRTGTYRPLARRCRSVDELRAAGWRLDGQGVWHMPGHYQRPQAEQRT